MVSVHGVDGQHNDDSQHDGGQHDGGQHDKKHINTSEQAWALVHDNLHEAETSTTVAEAVHRRRLAMQRQHQALHVEVVGLDVSVEAAAAGGNTSTAGGNVSIGTQRGNAATTTTTTLTMHMGVTVGGVQAGIHAHRLHTCGVLLTHHASVLVGQHRATEKTTHMEENKGDEDGPLPPAATPPPPPPAVPPPSMLTIQPSFLLRLPHGAALELHAGAGPAWVLCQVGTIAVVGGDAARVGEHALDSVLTAATEAGKGGDGDGVGGAEDGGGGSATVVESWEGDAGMCGFFSWLCWFCIVCVPMYSCNMYSFPCFLVFLAFLCACTYTPELCMMARWCTQPPPVNPTQPQCLFDRPVDNPVGISLQLMEHGVVVASHPSIIVIIIQPILMKTPAPDQQTPCRLPQPAPLLLGPAGAPPGPGPCPGRGALQGSPQPQCLMVACVCHWL